MMRAPTVPGQPSVALIASAGSLPLLQQQDCLRSTQLLSASNNVGNSTTSTPCTNTRVSRRRVWPTFPQDVASFLWKYVSWPGILVFAAIAIGTALQLVLPRLSINAAGMSRTVLAVNTVMTYMVVVCATVWSSIVTYKKARLRKAEGCLPSGSDPLQVFSDAFNSNSSLRSYIQQLDADAQEQAGRQHHPHIDHLHAHSQQQDQQSINHRSDTSTLEEPKTPSEHRGKFCDAGLSDAQNREAGRRTPACNGDSHNLLASAKVQGPCTTQGVSTHTMEGGEHGSEKLAYVGCVQDSCSIHAWVQQQRDSMVHSILPLPADSDRHPHPHIADPARHAVSTVTQDRPALYSVDGRIAANVSLRSVIMTGQSPEHLIPSFADLPQNLGRIQILSVDMEPVNHHVMRALLWSDHYELITAYSGEQALALLHAASILPDIMLLDMSLPGMTGVQVCTEVRKSFCSRKIPIILVTCSTLKELVFRGLEQGADDYMMKPLCHLELLACISTRIEAKRSLNTSTPFSSAMQTIPPATFPHAKASWTGLRPPLCPAIKPPASVSGATLACSLARIVSNQGTRPQGSLEQSGSALEWISPVSASTQVTTHTMADLCRPDVLSGDSVAQAPVENTLDSFAEDMQPGSRFAVLTVPGLNTDSAEAQSSASCQLSMTMLVNSESRLRGCGSGSNTSAALAAAAAEAVAGLRGPLLALSLRPLPPSNSSALTLVAGQCPTLLAGAALTAMQSLTASVDESQTRSHPWHTGTRSPPSRSRTAIGFETLDPPSRRTAASEPACTVQPRFRVEDQDSMNSLTPHPYPRRQAQTQPQVSLSMHGRPETFNGGSSPFTHLVNTCGGSVASDYSRSSAGRGGGGGSLLHYDGSATAPRLDACNNNSDGNSNTHAFLASGREQSAGAPTICAHAQTKVSHRLTAFSEAHADQALAFPHTRPHARPRHPPPYFMSITDSVLASSSNRRRLDDSVATTAARHSHPQRQLLQQLPKHQPHQEQRQQQQGDHHPPPSVTQTSVTLSDHATTLSTTGLDLLWSSSFASSDLHLASLSQDCREAVARTHRTSPNLSMHRGEGAEGQRSSSSLAAQRRAYDAVLRQTLSQKAFGTPRIPSNGISVHAAIGTAPLLSSTDSSPRKPPSANSGPAPLSAASDSVPHFSQQQE